MSLSPQSLRFSSARRHIADDTALELTSVGVDIGSSTSLLVFSRLELELRGNRYIPVKRTVMWESEILLTPYKTDTEIDAESLGKFLTDQYRAAGVRREDVDTGALILTGTALLRRTARAIGELFADEAGRFVAVSAGHHLEATMAAYGSGAAALSGRNQSVVLNIDIGGGTTKLALCVRGEPTEVGALDIGARLVTVNEDGVIQRLEPSGCRIGRALGLDLKLGHRLDPADLERMAVYIADRIAEAIHLQPMTEATRRLWLTRRLTLNGSVDGLTFSGGVSEFIYEREGRSFGDLGALIGRELRQRANNCASSRVLDTTQGIRATVIGASQYTVQVSGNTIFVSPEDTVPIRNVPVVVPRLNLGRADIDSASVKAAVEEAVRRLDLDDHEGPIAVDVRWEGLPMLGRLEAFCQGMVAGLQHNLARDNPLVLVCDRDVGGLLGLHLKQEMALANAVVSIDGVDLRELDFIDVGRLIPTSGAAPVVIKSLVFPDIENQPSESYPGLFIGLSSRDSHMSEQ